MSRLRVDVLLRVLIALVGGYLVANLGAVALATLMPLARVDAALIAIQLSFAVYTGAIIWVFAARSAGRAFIGLLLAALVCLPLVWLLIKDMKL
ncbi:DUF3649 domain-containing protein [Halopseudomonas salegens]|uniref:DUF3649 domain-containing protein n=1 Tax=Halopseudomonas salegens TaxID=1434072 RepID=A0A1H2F832_9GAMM|nr:DUF3649 domain-containing protein [Halopseudomonas salegens]SDU03504.1 Protein of unknown function [Halopseudomonas salegens]